MKGAPFRYMQRIAYGIWICIVTLLLYCCSHAQTPFANRVEYWHYPLLTLDLPPDTAEINGALRSANLLAGSLPDSARELALQAFHKSMQIRFYSGAVVALNILGLIQQNQGKYDSAISIFEKALPLSRKSERRDQLPILYLNIGNSYFYNGNYERALENYYLTLQAMRQSPQAIQGSVLIYSNIALLWSRLGAPKQALEALAIADSLSRQIKDPAILSNFYSIAGSIYEAGGKRKAIHYSGLALNIALKHKLENRIIPLLNDLAHHYIDREMADSALYYTRQAIAILDRYPHAYNYDRFHTLDNLGHIFLLQKKYRQADSLLTTTFSRVKATGLTDMVLHMEPLLAEMYATTGRPQQAYEHMQHYALLKDSIMEQQKARSLDNWMRSRMNEKDKAMLSQKLEIAEQQKKLQAKNFWIGGTALGSLLLLAALLAFLRSYKNKQKLQQAAFARLQQEQEINQLKAQVRGEEQERNRIALELHDGIASQLWAIKLNVDSLQQQDPLHDRQRENLKTIYQQLDETTQEVRKTAHNLMPDLLLEEGLGTALASLCDKIKKQTELEVDFLEYGNVPRMDEEIELSLYRMIQELIQNVLKHADGATQLLVQLSCIETLLNITVEDNGAGFAVNNPDSAKGIGLRHIEKRVKTLNGHIDLQSTPGKGTTVYLEFDIQHLL